MYTKKIPFDGNQQRNNMKMVDKSSKLVDKFAVISGTGGSGPGGGPLNLQSGGGGGGSGGGGGVSGSGGISGTAGLSAGAGMTTGQKPVPMKLFAAWEVDRTPPNCIPR